MHSAPSPVMQRLSAYIAGALRKPLPPAVSEKTKHHLLDTLAAMLSGSRLPPGKKAIAFTRTLGGAKEACVVGSRIVTAAANAALANGMLAHADETDDSHSASQTHPGCGVVAAALAMAERERASGTALLRAVALGYDVCCRLTQSLDAIEFRAAGHSTHSFGPTFGAAAAAGALAALDERGVRHLLSYAAQQASGISCWMRDEGHVEKAFDFGGMPARNGVAAASMVAHGFTGVDDVFSGERNFFAVYGRAPDPGELARGLGESYEIMNADIKRWSVGSPIQAPLDSLLELIRAHRVRAEDLERLVVRVAHLGANTTDNRDMPDICMQHLCAVMLLDGTVSFRSAHDRRRMQDRKVLELRRRIELRGEDELTKAMPRREGVVEITLRDGRELRHHTRSVRGTPGNPVTRAEVEAKSYDLAKPVVGSARARKLCNAIWNLEKIRDMRILRPLLRV
ncbi:MAG TPA: MmgE/PrpD family protein [Burkholderiales bacterium]|nr:MmgE/PrpD family protein [Burkholderiales bacterium]